MSEPVLRIRGTEVPPMRTRAVAVPWPIELGLLVYAAFAVAGRSDTATLVNEPSSRNTFPLVSDGAPSMVCFYVQGFNKDSLGTEDRGGPPPHSVYANSITGAVIGPATTIGVPSTPESHEFPPVP